MISLEEESVMGQSTAEIDNGGGKGGGGGDGDFDFELPTGGDESCPPPSDSNVDDVELKKGLKIDASGASNNNNVVNVNSKMQQDQDQDKGTAPPPESTHEPPSTPTPTAQGNAATAARALRMKEMQAHRMLLQEGLQELVRYFIQTTFLFIIIFSLSPYLTLSLSLSHTLSLLRITFDYLVYDDA